MNNPGARATASSFSTGLGGSASPRRWEVTPRRCLDSPSSRQGPEPGEATSVLASRVSGRPALASPRRNRRVESSSASPPACRRVLAKRRVPGLLLASLLLFFSSPRFTPTPGTQNLSESSPLFSGDEKGSWRVGRRLDLEPSQPKKIRPCWCNGPPPWLSGLLRKVGARRWGGPVVCLFCSRGCHLIVMMPGG